jgi:hypothetical protein
VIFDMRSPAPSRWALFSATAALALCSATAALVAHHSTAAYDTKTIALENAVVTRFVWANPHSVLWVEVKDGRGRVARWGAETGSPSALSRIGWSRSSVAPGDVILVELFPAKNGAHVGRLARIVLPNGKELLDSVYKDSPFDTIQRK